MAAFSASKDLKVSDIWAYKNRPGEDGSTLTILKIENYPKLGKIVHIRVDGFRMINPVTGNEFNDMPHLPFQAKALERSITHRIGETAEIPDFNQGYAAWRAAFDEGSAGAFKITVRQTLDGLVSGKWEFSN
ncbi:hypothetical protein [Pseudomonas sp. PDM25]|uniref:hypothetical protein n=1 Tax=Pseudomonas sp. PDM25 TaxID=2854772 RepID=UPI0021109AC7|nr:hypothetical protein [Pseudomonas sp. PDM25]